jgi:protein O-GlcNAc transferase
MQPSISQSQQILARAFAAHQAGNIAQAEFLYKLVLQADRKQFDALHRLGVIEGQRGDFAAALSRIQAALRVRPKALDALISLGWVQSELGHRADAVATYKKAVALDPRSATAHSNLSIVLRRHGERDDALTHCDQALKLAPDYAAAWNNRGNVLFDLDRRDEALADYDKAIALQPNLADAHLGRGNIFFKLERRDEALAAYDRALAINPNLAEAWLGRGNLLMQFKRHDAALTAYDRAVAINPNRAEAWFGRGNVFIEFKRHADALAAFDKALSLNAQLPKAPGHRLHAKLNLCDWTNLEAETAQLLSALRDGKPVSDPFPMLSLSSSPADQLQCARRYVKDQSPVPQLWRGEVYSHDRIRVAYVSADFSEHATALLTAGLFEQHDGSRFEVTAISLEPEQDSGVGRRLKASFDRFIDCHAFSDQQIADLIRQLEIDILVDLKGFTQDCRPAIFVRRPAPIQVNWLGYPGTMGADYIDYVIADRTVIPQEHFEFYSEKIVWLPDSYQVNDSRRLICENAPARRALNLPDDGLVFCCFNNSYKITPTLFSTWMRLLQQVEGSVLWLLEDNALASSNLRLEAERQGMTPDRLVFAPRVPLADHLARHRQADLFLDTLPYNAHTTASDALWAGVPVLTCIGSTFAGRVAASVLHAIGLPELVTESLADYVALALNLAREP